MLLLVGDRLTDLDERLDPIGDLLDLSVITTRHGFLNFASLIIVELVKESTDCRNLPAVHQPEQPIPDHSALDLAGDALADQRISDVDERGGIPAEDGIGGEKFLRERLEPGNFALDLGRALNVRHEFLRLSND